jgi:hypothetical protein
VLRLDDDQPLAHQALSHVPLEGQPGRWSSAEWNAILARRAEIQTEVVKARRVEIPLETKAIDFKALAAVDPAPASVCRLGGIEVISTMEPAKLERIVRCGFQAVALSNSLRGFPLEVPAKLRQARRRYVFLESKAQYLKSIEVARAARTIPKDNEPYVQDWSAYEDSRGFYIGYVISEVHARARMIWLLENEWLDEDVQPCLLAGHVNWLCLTCLGTTMPGVVVEADAKHDGRTSDRPRDAEDEQQARQLAGAGLSGARRWLLFKASHGEDPAWVNSFVDQVGKLVDLDLLKSTFVVEYLQELRTFDPILRHTRMPEGSSQARAEAIEKQLPEGLAWFERRFHEWLLPRGRALVQRLEEAPAGAARLSKDEQAALAELDRIRQAAWDASAFGPCTPATFDRELADGCAAHVRYLKLHPAQLEKWPDAHEEYPEQAGFTTAGCWSGMHSVIAPGVDSAEAAIAGWMGTFYHRLPLLEPGLKRIGYSLDDHVAVLDASSLCEADELEGYVLWPAREMKDVPLRFNAELPNPVPGADQSGWGYPITVQTSHKSVEMKMKLVRGAKPDGSEVDCHFSSPGHPTNLDCAPPGAWCLIPKSTLDGKAKYTVVAEVSNGDHLIWTFTTGG